jgi:hypothetical protein
MSAWSQHIMIYHAFSYIHSFFQNVFFFVDVRHCFGLQETQAASADARPYLHSKLGASQSFSRKITTRYLLKLIIPFIIYYHSTLRMTDSISPAGCLPITTLLVLFYHFVNVRLTFDIVWSALTLQETQAASADARPNHHSKLGASQFLSPRITRSCVPLMPAPAAAAAAPAAEPRSGGCGRCCGRCSGCGRAAECSLHCGD